MVIILLQKKKEKTWSLYFFCTQEETTNIFGLLVHLKTIATTFWFSKYLMNEAANINN